MTTMKGNPKARSISHRVRDETGSWGVSGLEAGPHVGQAGSPHLPHPLPERKLSISSQAPQCHHLPRSLYTQTWPRGAPMAFLSGPRMHWPQRTDWSQEECGKQGVDGKTEKTLTSGS